jgi:hypothetical protein
VSSRARRAAALAIVVAALAALRALVPDPAQRRDAMLLAMIPLGYGHVLGAVWFGARRGRRLRELASFAAAAIVAVGLAGAVPGATIPLAVALAAAAIWHGLENEVAIGAVGRGGRLPALPRAPRGHVVPLAATATAIGVGIATPWLAAPALRAGLPVPLAVWTAEEVFAALLLHHVVSWGLHAARPGRVRAVVALHALPLAVGAGGAAMWPAAHAVATAPLPYLVVAVAHALHTAWQRGLAPRPR